MNSSLKLLYQGGIAILLVVTFLQAGFFGLIAVMGASILTSLLCDDDTPNVPRDVERYR